MTLATARTLVALAAAPPALREAVLGDLEEEHHLLVERRGEAAAARWLRRQVLASFPRLLWLSLATASGAAWLRATGVVAAGYAALALAVAWIGHAAHGPVRWVALALPVVVVVGVLVGARRRRPRGRRPSRRPPSEPPAPPPVQGEDAA